MNDKFQKSLDKISFDKGFVILKEFVEEDVKNLQELIDKYKIMENQLESYEYGYAYMLVGIVGTDIHDTISIRDNKIRYYNLQNGGGCACGEPSKDWYEFVLRGESYD